MALKWDIRLSAHAFNWEDRFVERLPVKFKGETHWQNLWERYVQLAGSWHRVGFISLRTGGRKAVCSLPFHKESCTTKALTNPVIPAEEALPSRTPSLESHAPHAAGPTGKGPSKASDSSEDRRRKGRGRLRLPCEQEGCKVKWSNFGFPGGNGTRCRRHRFSGMTILQGGCEVPGCNIEALYNFPDLRGRVRCTAHKLDGMVKKNQPVCKTRGCTGMALYGHKGEQSPSFCADHKTEDMIDIYPFPGMRCHTPGCLSEGIFGHLGGVRQLFCVNHRGKDMVSLRSARCEEKGCFQLATYGWPGQGAGLLCADHKKEGMVRGHTCGFKGCSNVANFGFLHDMIPLMCKAHMGEGMEYLKLPRCDAQDCKRKAYYALRGKRASRCREHKDGEMVNVTKRLCEVSGCDVVSSFGVPGQRPTRCARHKEENMVTLARRRSKKRGAVNPSPKPLRSLLIYLG